MAQARSTVLRVVKPAAQAPAAFTIAARRDLRTGAVTIPVALAYERQSLHGDAARHAAGAARDRAWSMLDRDSRAALVNALHFCHQAASAAIDDLRLPEAWSADLSLLANAVCCEGGE